MQCRTIRTDTDSNLKKRSTMTKRLIFIIIAAAALTLIAACEGGTRNSRISRAMREYVEPTLGQEETFDFGVSRPCLIVIYNIENTATGNSTRHCADVIFSNDYKVILHATPSDFDPIEYAGEKVRDGFRKAFHELKNR